MRQIGSKLIAKLINSHCRDALRASQSIEETSVQPLSHRERVVNYLRYLNYL